MFLEMADEFFSLIKSKQQGVSRKELDFHGSTTFETMATTAANTNFASSVYDHDMADTEATVVHQGKGKGSWNQDKVK